VSECVCVLESRGITTFVWSHSLLNPSGIVSGVKTFTGLVPTGLAVTGSSVSDVKERYETSVVFVRVRMSFCLGIGLLCTVQWRPH